MDKQAHTTGAVRAEARLIGVMMAEATRLKDAPTFAPSRQVKRRADLKDRKAADAVARKAAVAGRRKKAA